MTQIKDAMKKPFNLHRFASNKIPSTRAFILVHNLRKKYVTKVIIDNKKIDKNLYADLSKKKLYVMTELDSMFSGAPYKYLNILVYLLNSSIPIQNIPAGNFLIYHPMALLEAIGNAYSYKNFRHPDSFGVPFAPSIHTTYQNKNDFKNILEILPLDWINFLLQGTNISEVVKIMCEINFDFSKVDKYAIRALRLNKSILNIINNCPNLKVFLASKN
jgi:hypothetical protein